MLLFISLPGGSEWFVILLVALLLFGRRLPEVARAMGQSITEFKRGMQNLTNDIHEPGQTSEKDANTISSTTTNSSHSTPENQTGK